MQLKAIRRLCGALLAFLLLFSGVPARAWWIFSAPSSEPASAPAVTPTPVPEPVDVSTQESATLRVKLLSLGTPAALGITLAGVYTVESDKGFRFARDTQLSVAADGENLLLTCGGLTIDMGTSLTFTRHSSDGDENGFYIHENERNTIYNGDLQLTAQNGAIESVLYIDVEEYLYGVVPYEMSDSFPIEALKAQAVAARTYAMSRKAAAGTRAYDVVDTTADQVFRGYNGDYENAILAVDETRGVVGRYNDQYATCYFSASNGGQTALPGQIWGYEGDYGYLDVRDDPYDVENPASVVKRLSISADGASVQEEIAARLKSALTEAMAAQGLSDEVSDITLRSIENIEPVEPLFDEGNRMYSKLRFTLLVSGVRAAEDGTGQAEEVQTPLTVDLDFYGDLKENFGLKINGSDWELVTVAQTLDEETGEVTGFTIESRRFGHGVGLSQRGAQQMAGEYGMDWLEILAFYYPGMQLVRMDYQRAGLKPLEDLPASVGYARAKPTPAPTPAPLRALNEGEYYARVKLASRASTLNVRAEPSTQANVVDALQYDQRVIVMDVTEDGWAHIHTTEVEGYVSGEYLEKE